MKYNYWQLVLLLMVLQTSCKTTKQATNSTNELDAQTQTVASAVATTTTIDDSTTAAADEVILNSEGNLKSVSNELPQHILDVATEGLVEESKGKYTSDYGLSYYFRLIPSDEVSDTIKHYLPDVIFYGRYVYGYGESKKKLRGYINGQEMSLIDDFNNILYEQGLANADIYLKTLLLVSIAQGLNSKVAISEITKLETNIPHQKMWEVTAKSNSENYRLIITEVSNRIRSVKRIINEKQTNYAFPV